MSPDRRTLFALFSLAFGLRVVYAVLFGTSAGINPHPETFDFDTASRIYNNRHWLLAPFTPNPPVYTLFLALVFRIIGQGLWPAILAQCALGATITFYLFRIGERRLGKGVGLYAALWFAISVHPMHLSSMMRQTILEVFLFVLFVYSIAKPFARMRSAVWSGIIYTALVYTEPSFILLLPVVLAFFLTSATHHRLLNLQYTFLFVTTMVVLALPWTARNYAVYQEVVPVSLRIGRLNDSQHRRAVSRDLHVAPRRLAQNAQEFWRVVRLRDSDVTTSGLRQHQPRWSGRHNAINVACFGILLPLALWGTILAIRRRHRTGLILAGAILSYFLASVIVGGDEQVRQPVVPLLILLAFFGLANLLPTRKESASADDVAAQV